MLQVVNQELSSYLYGEGADNRWDMAFADPPDGIGQDYENFDDRISKEDYFALVQDWLDTLTHAARIVWISFNAIRLPEFGAAVHQFLKEEGKWWRFKPCVQTYTFGQHSKKDLCDGHRPLWRLMHHSATLYPEHIKVKSWRQLNNDKRAAPGGRVPSNVFDFPRVTGNSKQRRGGRPNQLNEGLVERAILLSTAEGDDVLDAFSGTGTTARVCKRLRRDCTSVEVDPMACEQIRKELLCEAL